jgi:hypothetical protein
MVPNPRYHARVSEAKKWLLRHVPFYARWYRFLLFYPGSDGLMPSLVVDPEWPHPQRSVNAMNDFMREYFTQYMAEQIGDDPALLAKVVPTYPPFGKRMLQDNGTWLATLKRDNVDLVTEPIAALTPRGVRCADGSGLSESVLPLRARHQPRTRRQHHLPLRMPGPLHHGLPGRAAEQRLPRHGMPPGRARRVRRALRCPPPADGVVAPGHEQLVQERARPCPDHLALAPGRLLELDQGAGAGGLRAALRRNEVRL